MIGDLASVIADRAPRSRLVLPASGEEVETGRLIDAGQALVRGGSRPSCVAALLTNDRPSIELLLGAIVGGVRLVSVPLPSRAADVSAYVDLVRGVLGSHGAEHVVARDDIASMLSSFDVPVLAHGDLDPSRPVAAPGPGFELVQFSSGTTGPPKCVPMDQAALGTNIDAILRCIGPTDGDVTVSWLPLAHDMGLVGMVLASLCAMDRTWSSGGTVVLLEPERFLRDPASWLDAIATWKGTITAAPDFGYRMAAERVRRGVDLSSLRHAIVGGEIVRPATLRAFEGALGPAGLDPTALAPAYGMAELGLAATMTPPGARWRERTVDLATVVPGSSQGSFTVASSGPPLDGYDVTVATDDQRLAIQRPPAAGTTGCPPLLLTGDTGFIDDDGWVYVTGRTDDTVVANGRNLFAPEIERAVSSVDGVRSGRAIAFGAPDGSWVVVAERDPRSAAGGPAVSSAARRAVVGACGVGPDAFVLLEPGELPMTASGKPQRSVARARWADGRLGR